MSFRCDIYVDQNLLLAGLHEPYSGYSVHNSTQSVYSIHTYGPVKKFGEAGLTAFLKNNNKITHHFTVGVSLIHRFRNTKSTVQELRFSNAFDVTKCLFFYSTSAYITKPKLM